MYDVRLWIFITLIFCAITWFFIIKGIKGDGKGIGQLTVPLFFLLAFTLRIVLASSYTGFEVDINCFSAWSERMATVGPTRFYADGYFSDYPPLYLYILTAVGFAKKLLGLPYLSPVHLVILKMPAILCDMGIGYLIYRLGRKRLGLSSAIFLSALYLFQPVVLCNSCLWGQVDSVFTLLMVVSFLFLENKNLLPAMLFFGLGVLMKPQALIFAPVLILGVLHCVFQGSFSSRALLRAVAYAVLTFVLVILLAVPFGLDKVLERYIGTLGSYPRASVNGYNFWAGMGLNWYPQETVFCGLPCFVWGYIAIGLATLFSVVLWIRLRALSEKTFIVGSFLILTVFTFSVRMHERYLYPVMAFLPFCFMGFASSQLCFAPVSINSTAKSKEAKGGSGLTTALRYGFPVSFTVIAMLHFHNTANVLYYYDPHNYSFEDPVLKIAGICMTLSALFFYFVLIRLQAGSSLPVAKSPLRLLPESLKMKRLDYVLMIGITLLYSCFALRDLGDRVAPSTYYEPQKGVTMTFRFPEDQEVSSFAYYIAPEHNQGFLLQCREAGADEPLEAQKINLETVFCWKNISLPAKSAEVSMTLQNKSSRILELVFLDDNGKPVTPLNASEYQNLFDESSLYPEVSTFRNSTYFDEIYHARTAYEYLNGMRSYENTHPPFGKILISLGITLFGMNPFGWRIIGTLFGIAMLPILYLFAKRMTGDTPAAALTCFIFAFDFMHFAQTRIATIDVYIVFFVLCMYYFMYLFLSKDYSSSSMKKLLIPLGLCGISMGFGVASKWTGVYAGLGLGILFFWHLLSICKKSAGKLSLKKYLPTPLGKRTIKILGFCVIFFVVIPSLIYLLSYLPFSDATGNSLLKQALKNQETMYSYHSKLEATHYFASPYYEWPVIVRPIWYYSRVVSDTLREGISSFGNPLVWWAGLPAFAYMLWLFLRRKDNRAGFLVIGYLCQYLPWFFVTRLTFIYHYFPSVIFVVLMIGYSFRNLKEKLSKKAYLSILILYALLVFGLFLMFYPVLSGQVVDVNYVTKYLKWFKTWVLIAK